MILNGYGAMPISSSSPEDLNKRVTGWVYLAA